MKLVTILGARPQFIKAAAFSRAAKSRKNVQEIIIHTGQHYDTNMSDVFFEQMQIPKPDYFLEIVSKFHGEMTGRMIEAIEKVLLKEKPDIILVYGDTNSTLAGAIAAKKLHIKIAHVEAGLRSFNMDMPEEINRILTDRISDFLFCPGNKAIENLAKEGFDNFESSVHDVGDIMKDVASFYSPFEKKPFFQIPDQFVLATIHRAENTDNKAKLIALFEGLTEVSAELPVILPLHPRTKAKIKTLNLHFPPSVQIVDPIGYLEMIYLLKRCKLVVTDSGGLQKEAYFFSKPCITTREETEWLELVEAGYNQTVGTDRAKLIQAKNKFINQNFDFDKALYGDGNTAEKILNILEQQ